jgi:hypothetical protein
MSTDQAINTVTAFHDAQFQQQASAALAEKSKQTAESQGAALLTLLSEAAQFVNIVTDSHVDAVA